MQLLAGNQLPDLRTSLMAISLLLRLPGGPGDMYLSRSCSNVPRALKIATKPSRFTHFWQGAESLAPATPNHILTSKSSPRPSVFNTFDFQMCFAPQQHALFEHLNFQKCSEAFLHLEFQILFAPQPRALFQQLNVQKRSDADFFTFGLGNVLSTAACTF